MALPKAYLIPVEEADLEALADRCLERALKKWLPSIPATSTAEPDELLTPDETAKLLKVSKVTVWDWEKKGLLKKHHIGNQVRYLRSEVMFAVTKKQQA